ncbi:ChbG/HpnK family deacetylase [Selenomonas sp.]|uniref:ChbG/HpnK family deacetylase n=1 Tax=Selenomonas sp. TaxID=2053611 RepID=UPI003FA27E69
MKRIIVNADDFGRHVRINEAVERGAVEGVLRSATLMAGGRAFADAAERVRRLPQLGLGIHFTLVDGFPILPPAEIPSLVDENGVFLPNYGAFSKHYAKGGVRLAEVRAELSAQIRKIENAGLRIDHADSHQHMHALPGIVEVVIGLCREAKIPALRAPFAPLFAGSFGGFGQFIGRVGLSLLAKNAASLARKAGLFVPEHFAGIVAGEAVDEAALLAVLKGLKEGTTEVMMHPGTANEELARDCGWRHDFEAELAAILSARAAQILAEEGIEAVNFQALGGSLENES